MLYHTVYSYDFAIQLIYFNVYKLNFCKRKNPAFPVGTTDITHKKIFGMLYLSNFYREVHIMFNFVKNITSNKIANNIYIYYY